MSIWDLDEAIAAQRSMIEDDIRSAKIAYQQGDYPSAAKDLAAVIGEMGALAAFESVKDGRVSTQDRVPS